MQRKWVALAREEKIKTDKSWLGVKRLSGQQVGTDGSSAPLDAWKVRCLDIMLSFLGLVLLSPMFLALGLLSVAFQAGNPLFLQARVGRDERLFTLIKFRTMKPETESFATHQVDPKAITQWGEILRKYKLDEMPQLWNVLRGDMSLVGPRPCLPSQLELIDARKKLKVFQARPGITGLAQVQGIDMAMPDLLAKTDAEMIQNLNLSKYFSFLILTALGRGRGDRVRLK